MRRVVLTIALICAASHLAEPGRSPAAQTKLGPDRGSEVYDVFSPAPYPGWWQCDAHKVLVFDPPNTGIIAKLRCPVLEGKPDAASCIFYPVAKRPGVFACEHGTRVRSSPALLLREICARRMRLEERAYRKRRSSAT